MNEFSRVKNISSEIVQLDDIGNAFKLLENIVHDAMDRFVPKVAKEKNTDPPWYGKKLKHMNNLRRKAFKRAKDTNNFDEYNIVIVHAIAR